MKARVAILAITILLAVATNQCFAAENSLRPQLVWETMDGQMREKSFSLIDIPSISGQGLWIAFQEDGEEHFPGIFFSGKFESVGMPLSSMSSLTLRVTLQTLSKDITREYVLFSKSSGFGYQLAASENVYSLMILNGYIDHKSPVSEVDIKALSGKSWLEPFERTRELALNYALRSDSQTRKYEDIFNVQTRYVLPRLILVAEEWLDIPKEVIEKKQKSASPFGALDDLAAEMSGEKKLVPQKIPTYAIDVFLNSIEANGKYSNGFQASRAFWNDILEANVIYEATAGTRQMITASILFSQLQMNIKTKKSTNHILRVDAENIEILNSCQFLWEPVIKEITGFLTENRDWQVLIPAQPVIFYQEHKPIYATYAWFQVHPTSGRMIGMLPTGSRGATTDEISRLGGVLLDEIGTEVTSAAGDGAARAYFSQLAGLYVGAAGLIDGVSMTIADPSLDAMSDELWKKFLAMHALEFAQQFLEDNADLYDSYTAQIGFWQGAMIWPAGLGGIDVAKEVAKRAAEGVKDKAIADAKSDMMKGLKHEELDLAFDEAQEKYAPKFEEIVDAINTISNFFDEDEKWAPTADEILGSFSEAINEPSNL